MACPSVTTGDQFLVETLAHLDCQGQILGSFGFQSLAQAGSPAAAVLTALLTLFVALYGIRLLFGAGDEAGDLVNAVLKVGIVVTIAVSWPAWRTVAYDTVFYGPAEVAASLMPSTMPDPRSGFPQRLQSIDSGIAAFTLVGTGRQTGQVGERMTDSFRSIALEDEAGMGWARPLFLASTIGSLAALRIVSGLLLAIAPLMAGLLLFDFSRGLFTGWVRGLALTALGSLGLTVLLSIQVAVMDPWLADVLDRRGLGYATPTAPTELLALVLAFAIATAALLFVLAKVAFQNSWSMHWPAFAQRPAQPAVRQAAFVGSTAGGAIPVHSRALAISEHVVRQMRREEPYFESMDRSRRIGLLPSHTVEGLSSPTNPTAPEPLGSGYRRNLRRESQSHRNRNERR
jgi:type IV secretion system protein VirB6